MKKLLLLLLFVPLFGLGQDLNLFNDYKYIVIKKNNQLKRPLKALERNLKNLNFNVLFDDETSNYDDLMKNPNLALYCHPKLKTGLVYTAYVTFKDYSGTILYSSWGSHSISLSAAYKEALTGFSGFFYEYNNKIVNIKNDTINILVTKNDTINLNSEASVRNYFDNAVELDPIEGIWVWSNEKNGNYSRTAIIKSLDGSYHEIHLENLLKKEGKSNGNYRGLVRITAEVIKMAEEGIYMFKESGFTSSGILKGNLIEVFYARGKALAIREYPTENKLKKKKTKNGEWAGNGSGIIISKYGHIITNHHVIDDADDIEVEFILDDEVQKFNAEIVQSDKVNDLAIIKIVDVNFDGVKELTYNFKTRSSDVGTKVYAFGYPYALLGMGKEIKVTDGIISSKSGLDGDITKYQITAPIQGGNSGGPLFDDKGNFIGINSSGIDAVHIENVAYSIKTSYVLNLIDVLPKTIDLPSNKKLASLPLTEQIKEISKYVVLIKVK